MATSSSLSSILGILMIFSIFCPLSSVGKKPVDVPSKCTNILTTASLKNEPPDNHTLRVLVPWKVGFDRFVKFRPDSCSLDGFSIQVFLQALHQMQHPGPPPFKFIMHGSGNETLRYDDMIDMLVKKEVDAVAADLTITKERSEKVGFTVPYLPSSLVIVSPFRYGSAGTLWDFLKPLSKPLWLTLLGCFVATGLALYLLEDQNPDFAKTSKNDKEFKGGGGGSATHTGSSTQAGQPVAAANASPPPPPSSIHRSPPPSHRHAPPALSPPHDTPSDLLAGDPLSLQRPGPPIYDQASHTRRMTNAFWFTSLCVFMAQQESVRTHLGRFVTVMWLFVMLIFNSSYTASLASLLSAQKRYPTIESFHSLLKDESIAVGYQEGSFMRKYTKIHLEGHKLRNYTSEKEYVKALREGNNSPNGVGAVMEELPYVQHLLQSECDFTIIKDDHLPSFGGFGFAFRKGDPLIDQMSTKILELAEDATLHLLQKKWKIGDDKSDECDANAEPPHLRLRSFGGLFSIVASVYGICILWRLAIEGRCKPLIRAPAPACTERGSCIPQAREFSLSRRTNRVSYANINHDDSS